MPSVPFQLNVIWPQIRIPLFCMLLLLSIMVLTALSHQFHKNPSTCTCMLHAAHAAAGLSSPTLSTCIKFYLVCNMIRLRCLALFVPNVSYVFPIYETKSKGGKAFEDPTPSPKKKCSRFAICHEFSAPMFMLDLTSEMFIPAS